MTKLSATLLGFTQPSLNFRGSHLEDLLGYAARVSNPSNQNNFETQNKLFAYCMKNRHWSIFQMCNILLEIEGPRDITRQFLRHDSLMACDDEVINIPGFDKRFGGVQEFSQRYSDQIEFTEREFRRQDNKNRQNSFDDLSENQQENIKTASEGLTTFLSGLYKHWREQDVAKECARVILPEGLTMSRLCVNGTVRSWLHYLDVRDDPGVTQDEHVKLARLIKAAIQPVIPNLIGEPDATS